MVSHSALSFRFFFIGFSIAILITAGSNAQPFPCAEPSWSLVDSSFGAKHIERMPSGEIAVAGGFTSIGGVDANHVAVWNGQTFKPTGLGLANQWGYVAVNDLVVADNGDIIVCGNFTHAGGVPTSNIARWDGSTWHAFGEGLNPILTDLEVMQNGDVYAFPAKVKFVYGSKEYDLSRWDGASWLTVASFWDTSMTSMARGPGGELFVGRKNEFLTWNGVKWSTEYMALAYAYVHRTFEGEVFRSFDEYYPPLSSSNLVESLDPVAMNWLSHSWDNTLLNTPIAYGRLANNDLIICAAFYSPWLNMARWDGSALQVLSNPFTSTPTDLVVMPGGDLLVSMSTGLFLYSCPTASCYPDCDASGSLEIDDFICFQTLFAMNDPAADCDESGSLEIDDFICFQTVYAVGC